VGHLARYLLDAVTQLAGQIEELGVGVIDIDQLARAGLEFELGQASSLGLAHSAGVLVVGSARLVGSA
jgi:hypothetical protein